MLTKGQSVFKSLADFFEGIFQTALRKIFQNVAQAIIFPGSTQGGLKGLFSGVFGSFGGATPPTPPFAQSTAGAARLFSGLGGLGAFGTKGGAHLQDIIAGPGGGKTGGLAGFAKSPAGAATAAGLIAGGSFLVGDALKEGGIRGMLEGAGGGAAIGFSVGGPIGAAIGAAAGFVAGIFGGGEKRRAQERQRRADIQSSYMLDALAPESRSIGTGGGDVATDLTGQLREFGPGPGLTKRAEQPVQIVINLGDREIHRGLIRDIYGGEGALGDAIAYAAG
jgi:hypothetical protein